MRVLVQRCKKCGALGVGPAAVKLHPMNGDLLCDADWREALEWEASRANVVEGIKRELTIYDKPKTKKLKPHDWRGYITEQSEFAAWALAINDRRIFVHYFARAVYAWALKEQYDQV